MLLVPGTEKPCETMGGYAKIKVLQKLKKFGFFIDFGTVLGNFGGLWANFFRFVRVCLGVIFS